MRILFTALLLTLVACGGTQEGDADLKAKELELKEKELELKEKELNQRELDSKEQENKYKISRLEGYWKNSLLPEVVYIQELDNNIIAIRDKLGGELLIEFTRSEDNDKLFLVEHTKGERRLKRQMEVINDTQLFMLDEELNNEEISKKESTTLYKISVDEADRIFAERKAKYGEQ